MFETPQSSYVLYYTYYMSCTYDIFYTFYISEIDVFPLLNPVATEARNMLMMKNNYRKEWGERRCCLVTRE